MKKALFGLMLFSALMSGAALAQYEETKTITQGDRLVITLDVPDAGSHWEMDEQADLRLALVNDPKVVPVDVNTGAAGKEIWTFQALSYGETKLKFSYFGPSADAGPLHTRIYTVVIDRQD
jgi:predicted secreted protein